MDLFWRIIFSLSVGLLILILHKWVGPYPKPLPESDQPRKEIIETISLWSIALVIPVIRMLLLAPWLSRCIDQRFFLELAYTPIQTAFFVILPLYFVIAHRKWNRHDLGLTWHVRSWGAAIFAVSLGLLSGLVAYTSGQAVISSDPISAGTLLLLLYNNDFTEEFFHRGIILSQLERALGQPSAILWGGILFGITHLVFDFLMLSDSGLIYVFFAFLLQTMLGWMLGIIYMKTRSLWPGVACHYLVNWLPSILVGLFG